MATRITALTLSRGVLEDVARASQRLAKTQEKLASGKELTRPSDDPPAVGRALQLRAEMEGAQQLQRNVGEGLGWAEVTDTAIETINDALQRVRELTVRAGTDTADPAARAAIAAEVRGLIDSVKTAANAQYGGRYIFAGTSTTEQPYAMGDDDTYLGDTDPMNVQIGPGVTVKVNVDGEQVLGTAPDGLLARLRGVLQHLEEDDGPALRSDVGLLDSALDDLNAVRATVGATYNRLEVADGRLAEYEGTTLKLLSDTEDADIAKTMIDFSIQQSALQAGLKAGAGIVQNSLLDFLR